MSTATEMTMELVRFSVAPEQEQEFLAGRAAAVDGLRTLSGMLSATLARADDGSWLDVVLWATRQEALAAARAFQDGAVPPAVLEWASHIGAVTSMTHAEVLHQGSR